MISILMQIKLIFTRRVLHLALFWKWEVLELRNRPFFIENRLECCRVTFNYITIRLCFQNCWKSQTCALRKNWMDPKAPKSRVPSPWFLGKKCDCPVTLEQMLCARDHLVSLEPYLLCSLIAFITPTLFLAVCLLQCRCSTFTSIGTSRESVRIFSIQLFESIKTWVSTWSVTQTVFFAGLSRVQSTCSKHHIGKKNWLSMHPRNFGSDFLSCDHPSAPQVYQLCKISQSTGIPNKCNSRLFWREITWPPMSCEAETIIKESLKTKQKAEIVSASLLSKVLILA